MGCMLQRLALSLFYNTNHATCLLATPKLEAAPGGLGSDPGRHRSWVRQCDSRVNSSGVLAMQGIRL